MREVRLSKEQMQKCVRSANDRIGVSDVNFSYATQRAHRGRVATQFKVELTGTMIECACASEWNRKDEEWDYVGRRPGSTDFVINGYTVDVKGTYHPPAKNPCLAIKPDGKKSDLYVLAYADIDNGRVEFLGWAKYSDFPKEAKVLKGWRNPTLHIRASDLRPFRG